MIGSATPSGHEQPTQGASGLRCVALEDLAQAEPLGVDVQQPGGGYPRDPQSAIATGDP